MVTPLSLRLLVLAGTCTAVAVPVAPALAAPPSSQTATPTIQSGPSAGGYVASTTATFKFSSKTAKSTYSCSLDGAPATACTSPKTYTSLPQGKHTFTVTATAPGKTTSQPATREWTVDTIAPKPAVTAPSALNRPVVIGFGEAVTSRTKNPIATLSLTDSGTVLPAVQTCWAGSAAVDCATKAFDSVRLTPKDRLMAGQHYTVTVAAGVVQDQAKNTNPAVAAPFRGARSLAENAPGIGLSWQTVRTSSANGGSYIREHLAGASASWTFTGTSVTWQTVTGPTQGKADVYVDNLRKATVNDYSAKTRYKVNRTVSGLVNKTHSLRIVVLGAKGSKAGKGTYVSIDNLSAGTQSRATPSSVSWRRLANKAFAGGRAFVADLRGETVSFTFRGTGVTLLTQRGADQGKAQILVDNTVKWTIDNYGSSASYKVKRVVSNLSDAVHTVRVVVLGQHNKRSKGNIVTVDGFSIA